MIEKILKYVLFATPAVLLFVPDNMFFPFISGKGILFRFLIEIAFALYLFLAISKPEYRPKKSLILICVSVFTVMVLVADIFSPDFTKAFWSNFERMEGFVLIGHLFAYFVVLGSVLKNEKDWNGFWYGSASVFVAMNLFALFQLTGGTAINQGDVRVDALMGNSAYFAGFLLFQIFVSLFLLKQDKGGSKNILWAFFIGSLLFGWTYLAEINPSAQGRIITGVSILITSLMLWSANSIWRKKYKYITLSAFGVLIVSGVVLLFLTQTRGACLGFLGGIFITAITLAIFEKSKRLRLTGVIVATSILLLIGTFIAFKDSNFVKNSPILSRFAEISWGNTKGQARQIIWPMALKGVAEKPILGWGQEGFNYVFGKYYNPELWRHEPWFDRTHNVFLDWMVAGGILGFLAYLSIYISFIISIQKIFWKEKKTEFAILFGLLSAYSFQNLFIFDNLGSYIMFFALTAFLHSSISNNTFNFPNIFKERVNPALVGALCFVMFILSFYFLSYSPYKQNTLLIKSMRPQPNLSINLDYFKKVFSIGGGGVPEAREHFVGIMNQVVMNQSVDANTKQIFLQMGAKEVENQLKDTPLQLKPLLSMASAFNQNGNADIALSVLLKLREISPRKQHILMQLGISYFIKNNMEEAYKVLKESYELSPEYADGAMLFASAAMNSNRQDEGISVLTNIATLGYLPKPYIINDFVSRGLNNKLISIVEIVQKVNPTNESQKMLADIKGLK